MSDVPYDDEPPRTRFAEPEPVVPEPVVPEPVGHPLAAYPVQGRPQAGRRLAPALGLLVLLLAGLATYLAVAAARAGGNPLEDARRVALTSARDQARLVFSYDYRHLDKDFAAARAVTTGGFRDEYDRTTAKLVGDVAPRYKAVVVADVSNAAVETATSTRAVVLVFLNQQSSSSLLKAPKITQSRLEMTLVRRDGDWLVEAVKAL